MKYKSLSHFQLQKIWHLDLLNCHKFAATAFKLIKWLTDSTAKHLTTKENAIASYIER